MKKNLSAIMIWLFLASQAVWCANAANQVDSLQKSADLTDITKTRGTLNLAQTFSTLELVASVVTKGAISIKLWKYSDLVSECDNSGTVKAFVQTCPRSRFLISTAWLKGGGTEFRLFETSARMGWVMPDTKLPDDVVLTPYVGELLACEASALVAAGKKEPSEGDRWHFIRYRLSISNFDSVKLERLPDTHEYSHCDPRKLQ